MVKRISDARGSEQELQAWVDIEDELRCSLEALSPALESLIVRCADEGDRSIALHLLAKVSGRRSIPALQRCAIQDPDPLLREQAVGLLGSLIQGEAAMELLRDLLQRERDPQVRASAVLSLGASSAHARPFLQEALKTESDVRVRRTIQCVLGASPSPLVE
jgi:HEAT repeat protein